MESLYRPDIFEYLRFALNQLYFEIGGEYTAASRRKSYLATPVFIQKFKKKIEEMNEIKDLIKPWKKQNVAFIKGLPDI